MGQRHLSDRLAIHKRSIRGSEILQHNRAVKKIDLAVLAGHRRVWNYVGIAFAATDRIRTGLKLQPVKVCVAILRNESSHR